MELTPLKWDSDFFQLRIAKAILASEDDVQTLSNIEGELHKSYDLIYIFSELDCSLPFYGASLVDKKAVFSINELMHYDPNPSITCWNSENASDALISLALVSGKYSRFKVDPMFPAGSYERMYTRWIEQSVGRKNATEVFCYWIDNNPRGLITLDRRNNQNAIGLVAVDERFQNNGIGTALVKYAINCVNEHGGIGLSVVTQLDNGPACRLYSKCGFSLESVTKIWHWWL